MTWTELYQLFDSECKRAHERIGAELEKGNKTFGPKSDGRDTDPDVLLKADSACEFFAENRSWPPAEEAVGWNCFERMHAARDFCRFISSADKPSAKHAESIAKEIKGRYSAVEMITWILVDYWWHAGMWADLYRGLPKDD